MMHLKFSASKPVKFSTRKPLKFSANKNNGLLLSGETHKETMTTRKEAAFNKEGISVAGLLRLARTGRATASHLAQLEHKLHSGKNRLISTLTSAPKQRSAIYSDVQNKFNAIGQGENLHARIRNLSAQQPGTSWESLQNQLGPFQRDLINIKGQMPQNSWASRDAVNFSRDYTKSRTKPFIRDASGKHISNPNFSMFSKEMSQPNIHKSLFTHPREPIDGFIGGVTRNIPGKAQQIKLFPDSARQYRSADDNLFNLFHEVGHVVDPNLRQMDAMRNMQQGLKRGLPSDRSNFIPWDRRAESYADGFAGNMLAKYHKRRIPQIAGRQMTQREYQELASFARRRYGNYGGSIAFGTNTAIPTNYLFGIGDPMRSTKSLMQNVTINQPNPNNATLKRRLTLLDFPRK